MASPGRLEGKVAVISGAASGIGAAHARLFAEHGAKCLLCDIQESKGKSVAREIRDQGGVAEFIRLDVTNASDWQRAVDQAVSHFRTLTTLVNVAGIASSAGLEKETEEGWTRVVEINQKGTWLGMQSAIPALLASGNASIVNVASMMAVINRPGALAYQASKAAVRHMTKSVALEYASRGVRANVICPGIINTPMLGDSNSEVRNMQIKATPMKRLGQAVEVANCSLFLCSDEASYVTGAEIIVDGGTAAC